MGRRFEFFFFVGEQALRLPSNQSYFRRHLEKVDERKREVALLQALTSEEISILESSFQPPSVSRIAELARSFDLTVEHCERLFKSFDWFCNFWLKEGMVSLRSSVPPGGAAGLPQT